MDSFLGEIRMFAGTYAPEGWAFCDGSLLPISGNEALYSLLGTTYGGDGQTNFRLPDLRGRVPIHKNATYPIGAASGTETVTLIPGQMPPHTHRAAVQSAAAEKPSPTGNVWATSPTKQFANATPSGAMHPGTVLAAGGSQPHGNIMPFQCVNFIIAVQGEYPTQG
jgi:microcystin-dependent protein